MRWRRRRQKPDNAHVGRERDVYELMRTAAGDDLEGWEEIRDGNWTRPLVDGIRALIRLGAMRGVTYQLYWGLSLAWVPHLTSTGTSLHRTAKSARLDLFEEGQFREARVSFEWGDGDTVIWLPEDLERCWRTGFELANAFFARATGPEAVLALAEEQMEDRWAMSVHMPGPVYVATFTLAHLGREAEARAMLDRQLHKWYLHPDAPQVRDRAAEKMERALERTLKA